MNAVEHIVEAYYRICRGCFTMHDVKVEGGNNRQFDLLAYNLKDGSQYHIEVSVIHSEHWCPTPEELIEPFQKKFLGWPERRDGRRTDATKGKTYEEQIHHTYLKVGFKPESIQRVWICWLLKNRERLGSVMEIFCQKHHFSVDVVDFRDEILKDFWQKIGTSNYDDEVLRTLSLLKQKEVQMAKKKAKVALIAS